MMTEKPICLIPARGNSKGIPGKNIRPLAGKPMIAWSIENAMESRLLNGQVYVTSDSDEILKISEQYGAKPIKRPDSLAGDKASSESALIHAYEEIKAKVDFAVHPIVFLQPTSPIRDHGDIDRALTLFQNEKADSLFSSRPLQDFCQWGKRADGHFYSKTFDYKNRLPRQQWETTYLENGSMYIFKPSLLYSDNNRLGGKIITYEMDIPRSIQIDSHEDLDLVEFYLKRREK